MAVYLADPFDASPIGSGSDPVGFSDVVPTFFKQILGPNDTSGLSSLSGGVAPGHNWFQCQGEIATVWGGRPIAVTAWLAFRTQNPTNGGVFNWEFFAAPAAGVNYIALLKLFMDADYTFTLQAADGTFLGNTGLSTPAMALRGREWFFFQLNLAVTGDPVIFTYELYLNGLFMFSGTTVPSGVSAASMFGGIPAVDGLNIGGPGFSNFAQCVVADPVGSSPDWPAGVSPVTLRVTQMPMEAATEPDNANLRVTQMPNEYATKVTAGNKLRGTQIVIEWVWLGREKWYVTES